MDRSDVPLVCGQIALIHAVDWGLEVEQLPGNSEFQIVRGRLYGQVVRMTESGITLAPQVFADGSVRCAITIPYCAIEAYALLEPVEGILSLEHENGA